MAAGCFIYASTVVKFVASESDLPAERFALITSLPESTVEEGKSGVDQLYARILQQAFGCANTDNHQKYLHFQTVVGTVLLLFNPLSIKGLSELMGYSTQWIHNTLCSLHSLLIPENMEESIRIFHLILQVGDDVILMFEPLLQNIKFGLYCFSFLPLQQDNLAAVVVDLLGMFMKGRFQARHCIGKVVILPKKLALIH